jgi:hypothetical protein
MEGQLFSTNFIMKATLLIAGNLTPQSSFYLMNSITELFVLRMIADRPLSRFILAVALFYKTIAPSPAQVRWQSLPEQKSPF